MTRWETFPVTFTGGLVTNISPLQQGLSMPGSARVLTNFEPSIEGGYRRILGYEKYDSTSINPYGSPVVQGGGQSGTTLLISNLHVAPIDGDTFQVSGISGTYTIDTGGVSYDNTNKRATLTLTSSLASSPADNAAVTFTNNSALITGVAYFNNTALAARGADLWESSGAGWAKKSTPSYGTCLVAGGSQTGTSLDVDGLTVAPKAGDTFRIGGVSLVYTVTADSSLVSDAATLTISPALASSPADNAAITFLSFGRESAGKVRWERYNFNGTDTLLGVDGVNTPFKYDGTTFTELSSVPSEVATADHVAEFKNHIFLSKGTTLVFSAPYSDTDYTSGSGGGSIVVPSLITGLILFREQLIIFCKNKIFRITGNTVASFQLAPISDDTGCVEEDTIQEIGGDIIFMGPDGIRLLSATDRIGDFGFAVSSRVIQKELSELRKSHTVFNSCVIRSKSQYRVFGYRESTIPDSASGFLGTQFVDQSSSSLAWAHLKGFKVYCIDSYFDEDFSEEVIIFANSSGFVYRMESSNSLDGGVIKATFYTPFFSISDPRLRKTIYKLHTYIDSDGSIEGEATLKFDFDDPGIVQPSPVILESDVTTATYYGTAIYGTSTYGGRPVSLFTNQVVGSGFTVSVQYNFNNTSPPFSLDALVLEVAREDRQ